MLIPIVISSLLISELSAMHNCSTFKDRNHGFGCEIKDLKSDEELRDIKTIFKTEDEGKSDNDIIWIQIRNSVLFSLSEIMFSKFNNLKKIIIINSTGLNDFEPTLFSHKISLLLLKTTDLEAIGEYMFQNLSGLTTLSLNYNQITTIHKNAFKDLVELRKIELVGNYLRQLDDDTFKYNLNLQVVFLYKNLLKSVPEKLFGRNIFLESLFLQHNKISQIEEGFQINLKNLVKINMTSNICINEAIILESFQKWKDQKHKFRKCFDNFELYNQINDEETFAVNEGLIVNYIHDHDSDITNKTKLSKHVLHTESCHDEIMKRLLIIYVLALLLTILIGVLAYLYIKVLKQINTIHFYLDRGTQIYQNI